MKKSLGRSKLSRGSKNNNIMNSIKKSLNLKLRKVHPVVDVLAVVLVVTLVAMLASGRKINHNAKISLLLALIILISCYNIEIGIIVVIVAIIYVLVRNTMKKNVTEGFEEREGGIATAENGGKCYWMNPNNNNKYELVDYLSTREECRQMDGCHNGGENGSGGGCYSFTRGNPDSSEQGGADLALLNQQNGGGWFPEGIANPGNNNNGSNNNGSNTLPNDFIGFQFDYQGTDTEECVVYMRKALLDAQKRRGHILSTFTPEDINNNTITEILKRICKGNLEAAAAACNELKGTNKELIKAAFKTLREKIRGEIDFYIKEDSSLKEDAINELTALDADISTLQNDIAKLDEGIQTAQNNINGIERDLVPIESEIESQQKEEQRISRKIDELVRQQTEIELSRQKLESQKTVLEQRLDVRGSEITDFKTVRKGKEDDLTDFKTVRKGKEASVQKFPDNWDDYSNNLYSEIGERMNSNEKTRLENANCDTPLIENSLRNNITNTGNYMNNLEATHGSRRSSWVPQPQAQ